LDTICEFTQQLRKQYKRENIMGTDYELVKIDLSPKFLEYLHQQFPDDKKFSAEKERITNLIPTILRSPPKKNTYNKKQQNLLDNQENILKMPFFMDSRLEFDFRGFKKLNISILEFAFLSGISNHKLFESAAYSSQDLEIPPEKNTASSVAPPMLFSALFKSEETFKQVLKRELYNPNQKLSANTIVKINNGVANKIGYFNIDHVQHTNINKTLVEYFYDEIGNNHNAIKSNQLLKLLINSGAIIPTEMQLKIKQYGHKFIGTSALLENRANRYQTIIADNLPAEEITKQDIIYAYAIDGAEKLFLRAEQEVSVAQIIHHLHQELPQWLKSELENSIQVIARLNKPSWVTRIENGAEINYNQPALRKNLPSRTNDAIKLHKVHSRLSPMEESINAR